jgi:hypothetical protein
MYPPFREGIWAGIDAKLGVRLMQYLLVQDGGAGGWALVEALFQSQGEQAGLRKGVR